MKKLTVLFTILNVFLSYLNCDCISKKDFKNIEITIYNWHRKMDYMCFIATKFKKIILRTEEILCENKQLFNEFIEYIDCLKMKRVRQICIISANYRFYKWLFYFCKKFKPLRRILINYRSFVEFEEDKAEFEEKLEWIKITKIRLNNMSNESKFCRKNFDCVYKDLLRLEERIITLENVFEDHYCYYDNIFKNLENQAELFTEQRLELNFKCCCWA